MQINEGCHDSRDAGEIKVVIDCGEFVLKHRSSNYGLVIIRMVVKEGSE